MKQDPIDPTGILEIAEAADYDPIEDDVELVSQLLEKFQRCWSHKSSYERDWELYRLYHKGDQYLYRDKETGDVVRLSPRASKRLFSQNNQMRPAARSLVGKLGRMIPTFNIIPPTTDSDEVHGARVAEAFVEFFRRKEKLDGKYLDVCEAVVNCGTGILQIEWDPQAGRTIAWCQKCQYTGNENEVGADCPVCEADLAEAAAMEEEAAMLEAQAAQMAGQLPPEPKPNEAGNAPIPKLEETHEGDCLVKLHDTRDVFPEPGVVAPEKLRYCFVRTVVPLSEVRRRFPTRGQFVDADAGQNNSTSRYAITYNDAASPEYQDDQVTLYEYHEVASDLYPKGRVIWFTAELILEEQESPYFKLRRLPFYFFRWLLNPGEFWGESPAAQAWHRQKELNALETVIREYEELMVRLKVIDPLGSKITVDEFTPVTGQRVKYNPVGGKPEYMVPPEMPQGVFARRAELIEDIRIQYAISATEFGMQQEDPNGRAMAIVEAESDQQVGPILRRMFIELSELVRGVLIIVQTRYSPERQFTVSGDDGFSETFIFDEMNLDPGFDLVLEPDDGLAKNQAVRLTQTADLANLPGLLTDPMTGMIDAPRFAKMAKLKIPGVGTDLVSTEYAAAMELIRKVSHGIPPEMAPEDDAATFAKVLLGWLRGRGRKADPMLRQQIRMLWMQYGQLAMMQAPVPQMGQPSQLGPMGQPPGAGPGGPDATAMGGTPNNPGHLASDMAGGSVVSDAERGVDNADQQAEQQAQVSANREG